MTPPAPAAGWDAQKAAQAMWDAAPALGAPSVWIAFYAKHLSLARSTTPSAEAMREAAAQACFDRRGKRDDTWYEACIACAERIRALPLTPAQPPTVGDDDESTRDTLLLLNEAISLGRRDGMCGQHLDAMCSARDEIERLSVLTTATLPAVRRHRRRRAVLAALRAGVETIEDTVALEAWLRENGGVE